MLEIRQSKTSWLLRWSRCGTWILLVLLASYSLIQGRDLDGRSNRGERRGTQSRTTEDFMLSLNLTGGGTSMPIIIREAKLDDAEQLLEHIAAIAAEP